jgi:hypothetical protein
MAFGESESEVCGMMLLETLMSKASEFQTPTPSKGDERVLRSGGRFWLCPGNSKKKSASLPLTSSAIGGVGTRFTPGGTKMGGV